MKIAFFDGNADHLCRAKIIAQELKRKGHNTIFVQKDEDLESDVGVLVIDHFSGQRNLLLRAKNSGIKTVLIDGIEEDILLADLSISAFFNQASKYKGAKYITVPTHYTSDRYRPYKKNTPILVSVEDSCIELVLDILQELNLNAIVIKNLNYENLKSKYSKMEIFSEEDYYTPMNECIIGIMNGGLTLFQGLYYGLPCLAIPQNEYQKLNIGGVEHCCVPTEPNRQDIKEKVQWLLNSEYLRESISKLAQYYIDGRGVKRICDLIGIL